MFDLYPRHSHRTPQQIAEDSSGSFEPTVAYRRAKARDFETESARGGAGSSASEIGKDADAPRAR